MCRFFPAQLLNQCGAKRLGISPLLELAPISMHPPLCGRQEDPPKTQLPPFFFFCRLKLCSGAPCFQGRETKALATKAFSRPHLPSSTHPTHCGSILQTSLIPRTPLFSSGSFCSCRSLCLECPAHSFLPIATLFHHPFLQMRTWRLREVWCHPASKGRAR